MQPAYGVQVSDLTYTAPGSAHKFCQGQSQLLSVVSVLIVHCYNSNDIYKSPAKLKLMSKAL